MSTMKITTSSFDNRNVLNFKQKYEKTASINAVNNSAKTFYLYVLGYIPVRRSPLAGEQIGCT